jgi:photosystem II stability/assembly factor-like uncharacterized protein
MDLAHLCRRSSLAVAVLVLCLLTPAGAAVAGPVSSGADVAGQIGARLAPRTLNPFTAMDCVSVMKAWAVSLEANVKTMDGGATWKPFSLPGDMRYDPQAVDFVNARIGFIVGIDRRGGGAKAVVLKTTDGGAHWSVKRRFPFDLLAGVSFVSTQKGWIVGRGGRIYKTVNGGATWFAQDSPTGKTLYAVKFVDARRGWAVGVGGRVAKTLDGGRTWKLKRVTTADLFTVDSVGMPRAWIGGAVRFESGRVLGTRNAGKAWTYQSGPGGTMLQPVGSIDFWDRDHGILGGVGTLLYTTDGGTTWAPGSPQPSGIMAVAVRLADQKVGFAACTNYTIMKTLDGGVTWTTVLAPAPLLR